MPKPKYEYSVEYPEKDRNLTKREIIFLRKLCRTSGRRLVDEIAANPNHKWRSFFLAVWYNVTQERGRSGFQSQACLEAMCEVEPGTFNNYWLAQGIQQKRTYRTNRFEENLNHASNAMARGRWKNLAMLWRVDTDLNAPGAGYDARVRDVTSYVVANNIDEAESVWQTMVMGPLGIDPESSSRRRGHARFIGPASCFNAMELNIEALAETKTRIEKKRAEFEKTLEDLKATQARSEFAFALINQTLAMVGPSESQVA